MKLKILLFIILIPFSGLVIGQNFALNFDGDGDEVRIGNNPIFEIQDQFTIEAWINATAWRQEIWQGSIVCKDGPSPDSGFAFRCGKQGSLSFVMSVNNTWREVATGAKMDLSVWNHVAVVVDNGSMTLYINGEEEATLGYSGSPTGSSFVNLKIGASGEFPGRVFNGAIDEVRIWNIARSQAELNQFKNESLEGTENGLISYFNFDEGTGMNLGNKVDENLDGVLINMTEEDWVGGASISSTDAGVTKITHPDMVNVYKRPVRVGVEVKNFGTDPLSNVPIELMVNGEVVASEIIAEAIEADAKLTYFFNSILDLRDADNIQLTAQVKVSDDGNTLNDFKNLNFEKQSNPSIINIFDQQQHNFGSAGQSHLKNLILPYDFQIYEQVLLHISLECPSSGCDPWDQPANISITKDGEEFEIARYITPYGKACGPWTVDITDFKSLLGGATDFKSFIQVFGPSGWLVNVDMELVEANNGIEYTKLDKLWNNQYIVYGDPAVSSNLPVAQIPVASNTQKSHMRMTLSGHGQGNTDNAAEFSNKTHEIVANNFTVATHNLWKADCAVNSCANQFGNWEFNRAGWCPGQEVIPFIYNTTEHFNPNGMAFLDYKFEPYTNALNTGYDGQGHTEPHYRMASYLIQSSDQRFVDYNNLSLASIEVMTDSSNTNVEYGPVKIVIVNDGNSTMVNPVVAYFINYNKIVEETLTQTIAPGEQVEYTFNSTQGFEEGQDYLVFGSVEASSDQNLNDNLAATFLNGDLTSNEDFIDQSLISVYPNPGDGNFQIESKDIVMKDLYLFNLAGKQLNYQSMNTKSFNLNIAESGMYVLMIKDVAGKLFRQKLVVIK